MFRFSEVGFCDFAAPPAASTKLSVHSVCARFFGRSYKVRSRLWVTIEGAAADGTSATGSVKIASIHLAAEAILSLHATILDSKIGLAAVVAALVMIAAPAAVIDSAAADVALVAAVAAGQAVVVAVSIACPRKLSELAREP